MSSTQKKKAKAWLGAATWVGITTGVGALVGGPIGAAVGAALGALGVKSEIEHANLDKNYEGAWQRLIEGELAFCAKDYATDPLGEGVYYLHYGPVCTVKRRPLSDVLADCRALLEDKGPVVPPISSVKKSFRHRFGEMYGEADPAEVKKFRAAAREKYYSYQWHAKQTNEIFVSKLVAPTYQEAVKLAAIEKEKHEAWLRQQIELGVMPGHVYENLVKHWYESKGYLVEHTGGSGDAGADLVARKGDEHLIIQCKRYSESVTNAAVQEAFAALHHRRGTRAVVVVSSSFTPGARKMAKSLGVELIVYKG